MHVLLQLHPLPVVRDRFVPALLGERRVVVAPVLGEKIAQQPLVALLPGGLVAKHEFFDVHRMPFCRTKIDDGRGE